MQVKGIMAGKKPEPKNMSRNQEIPKAWHIGPPEMLIVKTITTTMNRRPRSVLICRPCGQILAALVRDMGILESFLCRREQDQPMILGFLHHSEP
jgi:hypothetical protein